MNLCLFVKIVVVDWIRKFIKPFCLVVSCHRKPDVTFLVRRCGDEASRVLAPLHLKPTEVSQPLHIILMFFIFGDSKKVSKCTFISLRNSQGAEQCRVYFFLFFFLERPKSSSQVSFLVTKTVRYKK